MRFSIVLLIGAAAMQAQAQNPGEGVPVPRLVLTEPTAARTAPPSGPLNLFVGKQVDTLQPGAEVSVIGSKSYGGFGGSHVWLEVQPTTPAASSGSSPLWIYGGKKLGAEVLPAGVQLQTK